MAFKKGMQNASPIILEPIIELDITVPEKYMGDIIGDINSKRGKIVSMTQIANKKTSTYTIYKVHKGNNLGEIAKMFAVPIQDLRKRNNIQGNRIQIGQSLIIPGKKKLDRKIYRVRSGDNLGLIAQRLGVPIQHLKFVNGVSNPRRLRLGQKLVYYV